MIMRIFTLMMNKIFVRAQNIMRKMAMDTSGFANHHAVIVLFRSGLLEVGAKQKVLV